MPSPKRAAAPKDWQCNECGRRMTALAAERAFSNTQGCPKCGGADIELAEPVAAPAAALRFTLDGEPVDVKRFVRLNGFDAAERAQIARLQPGESMGFGGGAAAEFVLRCEAR